ncbi:MAG: tyrosine-type recombinase/integrase [Hydrogeniiclostridium mannosilyticum]
MPEVVLLLETGLRRGELVGLMWSDIGLNERHSACSAHDRAERDGRCQSAKVEKLPYPAVERGGCPADPLAAEGISVSVSNEDEQALLPNTWSQKLKRLMRKLHNEHNEVPVVTAHELRHIRHLSPA